MKYFSGAIFLFNKKNQNQGKRMAEGDYVPELRQLAACCAFGSQQGTTCFEIALSAAYEANKCRSGSLRKVM